jgi:response regulator of citrate/malate metabolism
MSMVIVGLVGFLLGGLAVRALTMLSEHHSVRAHELDGQYQGAKRAVARHLKVHGTLNLQQLERMMDISGVTALRYLDQMVRDRLLKQQGHRGKKGAFYTRP